MSSDDRVSVLRPAVPPGPLDMAMADCHAMQHQWRHIGVIGPSEQVEGFRRPFGHETGMIGYHSQCVSCTTQRVAWIARSGEKINRYDYVEGYRAKPGESLSRAEHRQAFAVRLFSGFDEPRQITSARRRRA